MTASSEYSTRFRAVNEQSEIEPGRGIRTAEIHAAWEPGCATQASAAASWPASPCPSSPSSAGGSVWPVPVSMTCPSGRCRRRSPRGGGPVGAMSRTWTALATLHGWLGRRPSRLAGTATRRDPRRGYSRWIRCVDCRVGSGLERALPRLGTRCSPTGPVIRQRSTMDEDPRSRPFSTAEPSHLWRRYGSGEMKKMKMIQNQLQRDERTWNRTRGLTRMKRWTAPTMCCGDLAGAEGPTKTGETREMWELTG